MLRLFSTLESNKYIPVVGVSAVGANENFVDFANRRLSVLAKTREGGGTWSPPGPGVWYVYISFRRLYPHITRFAHHVTGQATSRVSLQRRDMRVIV